MKKSFIISEEEYNKEMKALEFLWAREALSEAVYILRTDVDQADADEFMFNYSKFFNGDQSKGNPQLSICSIARFYRTIVRRAEKEYPDFFKSVVAEVNSKDKI